jgi:hypothetical protein
LRSGAGCGSYKMSNHIVRCEITDQMLGHVSAREESERASEREWGLGWREINEKETQRKRERARDREEQGARGEWLHLAAQAYLL